MRRREAAIVRALTAVVAAERWPARAAEPEHLARVTSAALVLAGRAPDVMRLPLAVLLQVFDAAPLLRAGRRFAELDAAAQAAALVRWRDARIGALRSFARYWESVVILAWYAADEPRAV